jgi:hypothetical protein
MTMCEIERHWKFALFLMPDYSLVIESKGSTSLIRKHTIGLDPEPVPSTSHYHDLFPWYSNQFYHSVAFGFQVSDFQKFLPPIYYVYFLRDFFFGPIRQMPACHNLLLAFHFIICILLYRLMPHNEGCKNPVVTSVIFIRNSTTLPV